MGIRIPLNNIESLGANFLRSSVASKLIPGKARLRRKPCNFSTWQVYILVLIMNRT